MSLFVSSLNSGSNGNCYYIANQDEAILVDGGISCRETEKRLKRLELSVKKVKAIFVTHEHGDHIHGVSVLSRKHQIPVYITNTTFTRSSVRLREDLNKPFSAYVPVTIGGLTITAFPKFHDACDPHSFIVSGNNVTIGIFTDIGTPCHHVIDNFKQCHAAFLESNYDEDMLENGSYPYHLKNRIKGDQGHLSNRQAAELFINHKAEFMSHIFLAHLSRDNNRPAIVKKLFTSVAGHTQVIVASRDRETPVYHIRNLPAQLVRPVRLRHQLAKFQLSLFS